MREASFVHQLRRGSCDVASCLASLLSLSLFNLSVHCKSCEHFVTHPVVVERHSIVSLDLDTLNFAHERHPLEKTALLEA